MNALPLARILIVDDEAAQMQALCDTLQRPRLRDRGLHDAARTPCEALRETQFDLLLTDLMMPGMDGVALLTAALEIDPQIVGILMTGAGTIETAVQAMKAGALDYVLKPFKLSAILPVLARAVTIRRLRLENMELRDTVAIHGLSQAIAHTLDPNVLLDKIVDAALGAVRSRRSFDHAAHRRRPASSTSRRCAARGAMRCSASACRSAKGSQAGSPPGASR